MKKSQTLLILLSAVMLSLSTHAQISSNLSFGLIGNGLRNNRTTVSQSNFRGEQTTRQRYSTYSITPMALFSLNNHWQIGGFLSRSSIHFTN
jgi:hypothetical protein